MRFSLPDCAAPIHNVGVKTLILSGIRPLAVFERPSSHLSYKKTTAVHGDGLISGGGSLIALLSSHVGV
jgi:hypothetical protein